MTFLLDNKSAINLAKDSRVNQHTKHINIAHHFVHENVENGNLAIRYCPGKEMLADGFTKPLPYAIMVDDLRHFSDAFCHSLLLVGRALAFSVCIAFLLPMRYVGKAL